MVPGLALDCRDTCELRELVGGCPDQSQLPLLRQHQEQVLVGQQDELAVAVASALPLAVPVLEVDAREDMSVKAEGMALVNHEVVEVRLQPVGRPALFSGPSAGSMRDRDAARAVSSGHAGRADQDVAVRGQGGLYDGGARPRMLPEHCAVGRRDARCAGSAHHHDLRDSIDRQELWRAIAAAARRAEPAPIAGGAIVGDEYTGMDDDDVADHQR